MLWAWRILTRCRYFSSVVGDPKMAATLDDEIATLSARVDALRNQVKIQASTLLSAPSTHKLLLTSPTAALTLPGPNKSTTEPSAHQQLLTQAAAQQAHNQQCLYRACASITTFLARDPDPHAADGGSVLGIRLEVMRRGRFLRPYYVLLNRPYPEQQQNDDNHRGNPRRRPRYLRVHRHTIPASIPLAGLAARYLPPPPRPRTGNDDDNARPAARQQDLSRFARALRRELVRYHSRMAAVADLRKAAGLGRRRRREGEEDAAAAQMREDGGGSGRHGLVDISPADAEARQIKVEWADGRNGRLVVDEDGEVVRFVVFGEGGRDRAAERELLGGSTRLEDVARRLAAERQQQQAG
ncbi:Cenp-O kinetochore centromere component-domain-containing protein [Phialemonium atrogriseum]|uniref:Cenp-O kinetochore centromere component-domain-containing protein n=1 Tax=Phialemonium atrogriseum TaxID=1093897 RepID=A0AAJ0C523_9PEZI|nr:Cenp-O kinetochore centromere component-domain-containing protein [Phialemonium atrogriseum]KAK1768862.1 Cenp-O kinetochore centromere component-domain-containing protein [Phialemonium atrogriseum]